MSDNIEYLVAFTVGVETVLALIDNRSKPDAIRLAAGEMTEQEVRTTKAVLDSLRLRVQVIVDDANASAETALMKRIYKLIAMSDRSR